MKKDEKKGKGENRKKYVPPLLKKHKPLRKIVLLTGATVGSSAASFGVV